MSKIKNLGDILGVWAHPDDETFSSAGIMYEAAENGQRVSVINASYGENGKWDPERFPGASAKEVRLRELINALHIIGVTERHYLGCVDGQLDSYDRNSMVDRIAKIIDDFKPQTVLTFGPDGITGHPDHRAVYTWTVAAVDASKTKPDLLCAVLDDNTYNVTLQSLDSDHNIFFATNNPTIYKDSEIDHLYKLSRSTQQRKLIALKAHASQTKDQINQIGEGLFMSIHGRESFVSASKVKPYL